MLRLTRWMKPRPACYGALAEFAGPGPLLHAARGVRDAGYERWDAHAPYQVHGLPRAMGLLHSSVPWYTLTAGLVAAGAAFALQAWTHSKAYGLIISGKPLFVWQAYVPITFEVGILGAAVAAVVAMFGLSRLPLLHHPLFDSARFEKAGDDRFFISIESTDPEFDRQGTLEMLTRLGAVHVELIERDSEAGD